jgi:hypothetical protein
MSPTPASAMSSHRGAFRLQRRPPDIARGTSRPYKKLSRGAGMRFKIMNPKDLYAGLIFVAFGALFAIVARDYPMGSALRMGPAYFPTILGSLLVVLGAIIALRSAFVRGETIDPIGFREVGLILAALVAFGALLDHIGFVLSTLLLIFLGSLAGHEFRKKEVLVLSIVLCALAVGVFYYGLGLPFRLWPEFLS